MKKRFLKRVAALVLPAFMLAMASTAAFAQSYPNKPIKMIVPFPPGGGLDTVARVVAASLSSHLGVSVFVENRGGASGVIGVEAAIRAPADGYTLLFTSSDTLTVLPLMKKLPFNVAKDLTPVAKVADLNIVFVAAPGANLNSVKDVVQRAKETPGKLRFASPGVGSVSHMTFEGFKLRAGADIQHVPYNGGGPAQVAALAGQVELLAGGANLFSLINSGRLKGIAYSGSTRSPLMPSVPTLIESGYPGYAMGSWFGFFLPSGVSENIVATLSKGLAVTASSSEFKEKVSGVGGVPAYLAGKEFDDYMVAESNRWKPIVDGAKIQMD
jgi:tripartite-type tricarboxylate transporter receptor subunit TctC